MRECYVDPEPRSQHSMCIACYVDATMGTTIRSTPTAPHHTSRTCPCPVFPFPWPQAVRHVLCGRVDPHTPTPLSILIFRRLGHLPLHHLHDGCHNHFGLCRVFSVAYIALTILPCVYLNCPYRTPLSNLSWNVWHTLMRYIMALVLWVEGIFHVPGFLVDWRKKFEGYKQDHDLLRKAGLRKSVANGAQSAPEHRELQALNWFLDLPALSEDTTFQNFVSTLTDDTIQRMLQPSDPRSNTSFGSRLHDLLWSCLPDTTGLTGDARKHRLLTCLDAIYRGFRAYNVDEADESIPDNIRVNFAELRIMHPLWSDEDTAVSVRARCICALLARRILRDIGGPAPRRSLTDADIAWLEAVFGESGPSSNNIYNSLHDLTVLDNMNVTSFVRRVNSPLLAGRLTNKEITSILDTLTILMDAEDTSRRNSFQERIWVLIQRAETGGSLQQLVSPLLEHLRGAFPADVGAAPSMTMPTPMSIPVHQSHS